MKYFIEIEEIAYFYKKNDSEQKDEFEVRIVEYAMNKYLNSVINDESIDAMYDDLTMKIEEILKELSLSEKVYIRRVDTTKFVIFYDRNRKIIFEIFLNEIIREYTDGVGL